MNACEPLRTARPYPAITPPTSRHPTYKGEPPYAFGKMNSNQRLGDFDLSQGPSTNSSAPKSSAFGRLQQKPTRPFLLSHRTGNLPWLLAVGSRSFQKQWLLAVKTNPQYDFVYLGIFLAMTTHLRLSLYQRLVGLLHSNQYIQDLFQQSQNDQNQGTLFDKHVMLYEVQPSICFLFTYQIF